MIHLPNKKAVIPRQRDGHCRLADINRLAIGDSLEAAPNETGHLQSIDILQPHEPPCSPLEVLHFRQISLFRLITGPEGWTAESKDKLGSLVMTAEKRRRVLRYHNQMCLKGEGDKGPTLYILQGFVTVNDVQPLWMQAFDEGKGHQWVRQRSSRSSVKFCVQVRHFGIEAVWKMRLWLKNRHSDGLHYKKSKKHTTIGTLYGQY